MGMITVLGFAPFYIFPIPVITLALLFKYWREKSITPRQVAFLSFSFGMGLFGAGVTWIYVSLHEFGSMPMPIATLALCILCAYLALFLTAGSWLLSRLKMTSSFAWALTVAAIWVLAEWLRGTLFTGFPWLALGYSQAPYSPLIGFAPVIGTYGISLIIALNAALLALWFEQGLRTWRYGILIAVIWGGGFGLQYIDWVQPDGKAITVSLLQGNIAQDLKWRDDYVVRTMEIYARLIQQSSSQLIVTPEISIPLYRETVPSAYLLLLANHARGNKGDVLIGMIERMPGNSSVYYNSMFSFGSSPEQLYRKYHLVPFGEYIPLKAVFGWVVDVLKIPLSDFSRGSLEQKPMQLAGQSIAVNICYEDVFGEEIINQLPQASILVNVSNDAWFGRSIGPQQHLQISQMRALETGRYMLRATNTGVTAIVNERGIVLQKIEEFTTAALHGTAQGFKGATPYVTWGNRLIFGVMALFLCVGLISAYRSRCKIL